MPWINQISGEYIRGNPSDFIFYPNLLKAVRKTQIKRFNNSKTEFRHFCISRYLAQKVREEVDEYRSLEDNISFLLEFWRMNK